MENNEQLLHPALPPGTVLAPIHCFREETPLRLCVCARLEPSPGASPFLLLRDLPTARVFLGAICDAQGRVQEWVEVWVQTLDLREVAFSGSQEQLTNHAFDQRWRSEYEMCLATRPETLVITGMEEKHPPPVLIKRPYGKPASAFASVEPASWRLCTDDALLQSLGLPPYSTSPFRYLHEPDAAGTKTFLATAADAPANSHVQGIDRLRSLPDVAAVFNPHAGLVRVSRFNPLSLEDHLHVLEGGVWNGVAPDGTQWLRGSIYFRLQAWSASPKGMPFLLHGTGSPADRLNEIFFLKLSALLDMLKEVRAYVRTHQLPLLNLSPASFTVRLQEVGDQFPALWSAKCLLAVPGQAYPLKLPSAEQNYFIRLGRIEPSPFLPEGLGAHSFGIGSVRLRNVLAEAGGIVLEGTLVAEDYLALDPCDLLWFKLPAGEERLEFHAHVYTAEAVGPREARFRTVPVKLPEPVVTLLKGTTAFAKAPYEIWPLLSSPCDLHSLGILAIRILLANSATNLPVIIDDVLGLARRCGQDLAQPDGLLPKLKSLLEHDAKLSELVSPRSLVESDSAPQQGWAQIHKDLWLETIALLLRLFPGTGSHSYCKSFGDVSPLALETVFDRPVQDLETLVLRLRSVLLPSQAANEEIVSVILEELAGSK